MVLDSGNIQDGGHSQKSVSLQTMETAAYEIVVAKDKKDDRPIVGYEPIYVIKQRKFSERDDSPSKCTRKWYRAGQHEPPHAS
ncbi:unnamed protein product [Nesidiocoris tenuis]|uniref:Uncharacterized protein n=1 Tax=Nesidiocoris tenuis TaxID=355587 RepID=A0A6H5HG72_9HEMI|nr:unnamed protein product [Nesidiocoris tenuis]